MPRNVNPNSRGDKATRDYVFHYRLDTEPEETPVYHHRSTEALRKILQSILDIVIPLDNGKDIKVDGFRWLTDREKLYQLLPRNTGSSFSPDLHPKKHTPASEARLKTVYQNASNAAFYEPRINLIKEMIESLLTLIEFEQAGQKVEVDGFRLKNLKDWLVPSAGNPNEVLEYTGNHCNCDCIFCCNKGNPPAVATCRNLNREDEDIFQEIETRTRYFSPEAEKALFPTLGCSYETTVHPHFVDTLHLLRDKTSRAFRITTNGSDLTPEKISSLARLKPVYLYISLNSSSSSRRQKLMKDPEPETAINALPLLRQQGIPYAAVIVPWPVDTADEMLKDLCSTIAYAAEHEAHIIQINLPGYSKYFAPEKHFDLHQIWRMIIEQVRELRDKHDCPIIAMPTMYEENIYQPRKNLPQITGLIKNSPAFLGGLKREDLILQINGLPVQNRPQARDLLTLIQQSKAREINLKVQRNHQNLEIPLDITTHSYPYSKDIDNYSGIIFMGAGFRTSYLENLKEIIQAHGAKHVLFLSSVLVKPTFEQCLAESHLFGDSQLKIDIEIPENNFFGGNIFMGDLLVAQDFIDCVKDYIIRKGYKPDLVVIPSSPFNLSGWGRDLTGRVYLDIGRETGVPVELLHCATIYD